MIGAMRGPLTAILLILPMAARAALPPSRQRVRAFQAVVEAAARVLGNRIIDAVERVEGEHFRVRAGDCRVTVRLVVRPRADPGPQLFDAIPETPDCS